MKIFKKIFLLISLFSCASLRVNSQLILRGEYFINTDPGVGNGVPIIQSFGIFDVDVDLSIPGSDFKTGFNQLYIRVEDTSGNWSVAEQRTIFVDTNLRSLTPLINAEFFLDKDPGVGHGTYFNILQGDSLQSVFNIDVKQVSTGFHQLFIRIKDQNENWSIAEQRTFYIDSTFGPVVALKKAEYFFDTDPGIGNGKPLNIEELNSTLTIADFVIDTLAVGFHQLQIRVEDQGNRWSIAEQRVFKIEADADSNRAPIIGAEYFVNKDSGVGNNTAIGLIKNDFVDTSYVYHAPNLPLGKYTMNVRVKDSVGNWSIVEARPFIVCTTYGPVSDFDFGISADTVIHFTNKSQYSTSYYWSFGDGDTSNLVNPVHAYNAGTYNACLISKNDCETAGDTLCRSVKIITSPLAITLTNFNLNCANDKVYLAWQTSGEVNSSGFEIQKSLDGLNSWNSIGFVYSAGNSSLRKTYQFTDKVEDGPAFYRLVLIDKDGTRSYSEIIRSNCSTSGLQIQAFPVPASNVINLLIRTDKSCIATVSMIDVYGKIVSQANKVLQKGTNNLIMNVKGISPGSYFIRIQGPDWLKSEKVIIQH